MAMEAPPLSIPGLGVYHGLPDVLTEYNDVASGVELKGNTIIPSYITRIDPLSGYASKISRARADGVRGKALGVDVSLDITPVKHCVFCRYETEGARPQIHHDDGSVSMRNPFGWEGDSWVTAYPPFDPQNDGHRLLLSEMTFGDVEGMMTTGREIASLFYSAYQDRSGVVISFRDFTNRGPFAGGSQQHGHSQRVLTTHALPPIEASEIARAIRFHELTGHNIYDALIEAELQAGERVIYDNNVFIVAEYAPMSNNGILVVPKEPVTHVLQMDDGYMQRIIRPILGVFPALFFYRAVRDLNIAVHMAPFAVMDGSENCCRWHMHIIPRKSGLPVQTAGAEIGYGDRVIGVYPEDTAAMMREWYRPEGPNQQLVPPALLEHFHRHVGSGMKQ